jgi:hypothetical protein
MQYTILRKQTLFFILLLMGCISAIAQPDFTLPLVKPKKYENKILGSEKTDDKKFTLPRKLYQSTATHFNYYYNATNKLNAIVERAKLRHTDDYTELLPFYNYSTENTAADSVELDSIMYKATAGIVLHDLRNSYIDNLYLLIGQSYFYWQKFDSAYRIFQFINYNFFPRGKDEYTIVVGANARSSNGELNIGTKEKANVIGKVFTQPPSRNDALLWLARTYAEDDLFPEAYTLINLIKKDPFFPKRLHTQLNEVQAYVFYKQEQWDSTAFYLQKALPAAANKTELARWEFLLAQLYTKLNQPSLASSYYNKAKSHTTDPVMYIHARIYEAQLVKDGSSNSLQETVADLIKLSKKERFDGFEDVIYYSAAEMALKQKDTVLAKTLYKKSVTYTSDNPSVKNKSYIQLAGISFAQKDYVFSSSCYDSINYNDASIATISNQLQIKQQLLKELVKQINIVKDQDSLQTIAKMPEKEMDVYLKSLARKIRKQRGLKEEAAAYNPSVASITQNTNAPLFTNSGTGNNWYFYNASQKSKGFSEFKTRWGNRPNVDNWRRQAAVDALVGKISPISNKSDSGLVTDPASIPDDDLSAEGLKKNLPLTDEQLLASNKKIAEALFEQGQIYKNQFEDYARAAEVFEEILQRFSGLENEQEILFELYYCYQKAGNTSKASFYQNLLNQKYSSGEFVKKINESKKPKTNVPNERTVVYEKIYNLFIEGKFDDAVNEKKLADSAYGNSYWTPQLLYIEALYYMKQRNDSSAIISLTNIESNFPGTAMAEKAKVIKEVLGKRKEIEDYLTTTNIVRETEDSVYIPFDEGPAVNKIETKIGKDSTNKITIQNKPAQNDANITKPKIPIQKTGNEKTDKSNAGKITIGNKPATDSTRIKPIKDVKIEMAYVYNATDPSLVMIYFDEIDPLYVSEAKIAFQRYNSGNHAGETINIKIFEQGKELNWLELGSFSDVTVTLGYMEELRTNAKQIIPWLNASKYNFLIISERNLETLKQRKDIEEYKLFIRQYIKDKF